jgi:hypothetical protein
VGDVVKGNYSRFNLARFFGIGSEGTDVSKFDAGGALGAIAGVLSNPTEALGNSLGISDRLDKARMALFYTIFGSPVKTVAAALGLPNNPAANVINSAATSAVSQLLVNGFVNPIGYKLMSEVLFNPNGSQSGQQGVFEGDGITGYQPGSGGVFDFSRVTAYVKPRERAYDVVSGQRTSVGKITIRRPLRVKIRERYTVSRDEYGNTQSKTDPRVSIQNRTDPSRETRYIAEIVDASSVASPANRDGETERGFGKRIIVTHDELVPDLGSVFSPAAAIIDPISTLADLGTNYLDNAAASLNLNVSSLLDNATTTGVKGFMSPQNNAVVRAFENNRGRGLAGVIKQLSFNWMDFNWETDWGARAPMGTKVTISFECIHDLPPGLDASGYMRAPTHNVGSVMNTISGDPYDDGGTVSKQTFAREGASTVTKR